MHLLVFLPRNNKKKRGIYLFIYLYLYLQKVGMIVLILLNGGNSWEGVFLLKVKEKKEVS